MKGRRHWEVFVWVHPKEIIQCSRVDLSYSGYDLVVVCERQGIS
jgi:hypothetical protein